jgi:glyoxylase-like metal-dependent hydrolase (beta-lactamase superfamily II)
MQQITKNVFAETRQPGCNPGYLVTKEGIVLIDSPQQPSYATRLNKELSEKGRLLYLINTEHHRDHVIGNYFFQVPVISHEKTREAILKLPMDSILEKFRRLEPGFMKSIETYFIKIPSLTFSDRLTLYPGDHTLELIHLPGHTAGQTAVYIPRERVVFTGDNIFFKVQTFIHQGFPEQWIDSLKKIDALDVDAIVPGHGDVCDKRYIPEQIAFIQEWVETVKEAIRKGLTKEEAQAQISFLDRYPMDVGHPEERGLEVQRMNVGRLYDLYS